MDICAPDADLRKHMPDASLGASFVVGTCLLILVFFASMVAKRAVAVKLRARFGTSVTVSTRKGCPILVEYEWFDDSRVNTIMQEWLSEQRGPQPRVHLKRKPGNYPAPAKRYEMFRVKQ